MIANRALPPARVRFKGHKHWTEINPTTRELDIPALYVKGKNHKFYLCRARFPGWNLEAIDAASSMLVYEGLQNLRNLHHLKVTGTDGISPYEN